MHEVLRAEHDRMRALLGELEGYVARDRPPADHRFAAVRWMLAREHLVHSRREGAFIARTMGPPAAAAHDRATTALDDLVTAQVKAWDTATMARSWDRYRLATRALIRRLRWQMDQEDRALARAPHGNSSDASP